MLYPIIHHFEPNSIQIYTLHFVIESSFPPSCSLPPVHEPHEEGDGPGGPAQPHEEEDGLRDRLVPGLRLPHRQDHLH